MKPILCLPAILSMPTSTAPQAPQSAGIWRAATASRAATSGPAPGTLRAGIQVLLPSDAVGGGLTGILDGIKRPGPTYRLAPAPDVDIVQ
jgi:hypothetical protein